ncbi:MAG: SIS domain-containing protein [Anaerolineales bacterium]|nr:SIS domain-containing protein [Anaerolineales bacterium]
MITDTHLFQEISDQPIVLRKLLEREKDNVGNLATKIKNSSIKYVVIAARGSSDNVGRYAKYLLGAQAGLSVALATPSLFTIYEQPPNLSDALVLGISQSGQSPDIVSVLKEGRRQNALTLAITNDEKSLLASEAKHCLYVHAGAEKSVAATKTYTASLMAIAMLSVALSGSLEKEAELEAVPDAVEKTLSLYQNAKEAAIRWRFSNRCVVIGRGYNYATAFELALKLKELSYLIAEPYSPADLLHGPVAMVERDFPALVIGPRGATASNVRDLINELYRAGADTLIISDEEEIVRLGDMSLRLPASVPEWLSPITAVVAGQLFAMHLADVKKIDVDRPRGLTKVTRTH